MGYEIIHLSDYEITEVPFSKFQQVLIMGKWCKYEINTNV